MVIFSLARLNRGDDGRRGTGSATDAEAREFKSNEIAFFGCSVRVMELSVQYRAVKDVL